MGALRDKLQEMWEHDPELVAGVPYRRMATQAEALFAADIDELTKQRDAYKSLQIEVGRTNRTLLADIDELVEALRGFVGDVQSIPIDIDGDFHIIGSRRPAKLYRKAIALLAKHDKPYWCGVCGLWFNSQNPHTDPRTGEDCHEACCPECHPMLERNAAFLRDETCLHEWVSTRDESVTGGDYCLKCYILRDETKE